MFACSVLVIARRHSEYAVAGLIGVVVTQALGYGLIFDLNFFLRNLSVMGGLLMVLSDSWVRKTKAFAGLPQLEEKDRKMYFQLAGRVLLIFLFIGFVFSGDWSVWRVIVSLLGLLACVMVVVGFKAKFSATLLVVILSIFNVLVNNFWTVSRKQSPYYKWSWGTPLLMRHRTASRAPPPQGLRQVRFLPDPLHRRRSATPGQQRSRTVQHRREEEGLLSRLAGSGVDQYICVGEIGLGRRMMSGPLCGRIADRDAGESIGQISVSATEKGGGRDGERRNQAVRP